MHYVSSNYIVITCNKIHNLAIIPAWISNHMLSKVWDEITYPFPNFNGCTVEVWEWISNCISPFIMDVITHPCCAPDVVPTCSHATHHFCTLCCSHRFLLAWWFQNIFSYFYYFLQDWWPWPIDYLIRFWVIYVTSILNFQGQISNLLYDFLWPWSQIFKVKYITCYIAGKNIYIYKTRSKYMWTSVLTLTMTLIFPGSCFNEMVMIHK